MLRAEGVGIAAGGASRTIVADKPRADFAEPLTVDVYYAARSRRGTTTSELTKLAQEHTAEIETSLRQKGLRGSGLSLSSA